MDLHGIGYSNIRLPNDQNSYIYTYDYRVNTFPEEVFIHEFLHTLERNAHEYGYDRPELHDYAQYGYSEDKTDGLKKWYSDYMNKEIKYGTTQIGLPENIYKCKPTHNSNFKYSVQIEAFKEPSNIIETVQSIINRIQNAFKNKFNKENQSNTI